MPTALVRFDQEKPRGLLGRLRGAMEKWTSSLGGPELEARLARLVAPQNEYGVDPFGLDLEFTKAAIGPALWLYKHYFRVQTHDIGRVPSGPVLLVGNHSGQLPLDGAMIGFPALPITLTGLPLPMPVKYHLYFGEPMRFTGNPDDEDSELERKVREVKAQIQAMLNAGLQNRQSVFF